MPYDEHLGERIRQILTEKSVPFEEKKMFGGLAFMINGKMSVGIIRNDLMARVGPDHYTKALSDPHARPMDFTGRPMQGYIYVSPLGIDSDSALDNYLELCLDFNKTLTSR